MPATTSVGGVGLLSTTLATHFGLPKVQALAPANKVGAKLQNWGAVNSVFAELTPYSNVLVARGCRLWLFGCVVTCQLILPLLIASPISQDCCWFASAHY
ncbi:hypothetical protein IF2G_03156 [Cordyceps javanica]|nr:hypothetical protein IF2G_03156 [Cordyceps javanica]